jgi:hypothetical protein
MTTPTWRRFFPRSARVAALALQVLLWGAAPVLDARAEASSATPVGHVEEFGSPRCPPVHAASHCQTCRTLASGALAAPAPALVFGSTRVLSGVRTTAVELVFDAACGALGSRAPPRF